MGIGENVVQLRHQPVTSARQNVLDSNRNPGMSSVVQRWYYIAFAAIYHTEQDCPIGRTIPTELLVEGVHTGRSWCLACRARVEARLRTEASLMPWGERSSHGDR